MEASGEVAGEALPPGPAPAMGSAHGWLVVLEGFYEGLELPIDRRRLVIGRGHNADYVLSDPTISRAHAVVGVGDDGCFVQDLGSTNGTLVNGERADRACLREGDEIQMGKLRFRVRLAPEAEGRRR